MINYNYNEKKATQAAGVLLKKVEGEMDYYLLTKILYIAENRLGSGFSTSGKRFEWLHFFFRLHPLLSCCRNCQKEWIRLAHPGIEK